MFRAIFDSNMDRAPLSNIDQYKLKNLEFILTGGFCCDGGMAACSSESQPISCLDFVFDSAGIAHTRIHAHIPPWIFA
jgi:hypothetical protein